LVYEDTLVSFCGYSASAWERTDLTDVALVTCPGCNSRLTRQVSLGATSSAEYKALNKRNTQEIQVEWARQKRQQLNLEVVERYGGKCACCGLGDYRWLNLQHISGDGGEKRLQLRGGKGLEAMKRLRIAAEQPIREDLQLLCYNCHLSLEFFGGCPHKDPTSPYFLGNDAR
jgi:hypothetical protein